MPQVAQAVGDRVCEGRDGGSEGDGHGDGHGHGHVGEVLGLKGWVGAGSSLGVGWGGWRGSMRLLLGSMAEGVNLGLHDYGYECSPLS